MNGYVICVGGGSHGNGREMTYRTVTLAALEAAYIYHPVMVALFSRNFFIFFYYFFIQIFWRKIYAVVPAQRVQTYFNRFEIIYIQQILKYFVIVHQLCLYNPHQIIPPLIPMVQFYTIFQLSNNSFLCIPAHSIHENVGGYGRRNTSI